MSILKTKLQSINQITLRKNRDVNPDPIDFLYRDCSRIAQNLKVDSSESAGTIDLI